MRRRIARARSRGPTPPGIHGSATLGTRRTLGLAGTPDAALHSPRGSTFARAPPTASARRRPGPLFSRSLHPGGTGVMDRLQFRAYWHPDRRRRFDLREWRHLVELARAVVRAPLNAAEKLRAARFLALRAIWNRDKLARELFMGMRELTTGKLLC